jgi:hypothetical protein
VRFFTDPFRWVFQSLRIGLQLLIYLVVLVSVVFWFFVFLGIVA